MHESHAIRLESLTKTFGRGKKRINAVDDVTLDIESGQVYGFLGPNGAGKTTTIRLIMSLMRPTSGKAFIYGQDVRENHSVLRDIGALVEGAAFYPYLNGRKNLTILARTYGHYDRARIDVLLKQVKLADYPKLRFKKYSLGMKQRLGLAAALLHDPKLLIFDEPTNGLDPAGIQEMRYFIRSLVYEHGKTVFLSSHMLAEVEQICDRVAIINKGKILREGSVQTLVAGQSKIKVRATPYEQAMHVVKQHWTVTANGALPGDKYPAFVADVAEDDVPHMVNKLVENNVSIYEITNHRQSLEEVFLNITGGQHDSSS